MTKEPQPDAQQAEQRKRRREWALVLLSLLLVFALTQYESRLLDLSSGVSLANGILVLALININILLIILFFFLVFRNLFKLILEHRRGVPGAKIRSKLVVAFVALSLVPTMLLFFVSAGFITNTIENWFNNQIETSLEESLEVAETYYKNSASNALYYGEQLARIIKRDRLLNEANLDRLTLFIQEKQKEYNLGIVEVFSSTYEELVRVTNPEVPAAEFTDPGSDAIREALQGNRFTRITPIGKADLIRGIVPVYSNWNPDDVVGVVVVNYYVPHSLVAKMKEIKASFEQYKGTKMVKGRIQMGYVIVLLLIALVIIFLATWFGFHLARGITVPIQELAEATNRVAQGDLDVKIDLISDDEIGTLVVAFNTMTADLRKGQKSLQAANRDLQISNLELDQRRRYMEIVLRNITGGVIAIDKSGNLTTVNKAAEKLLNIQNKKILGKNFREVLDPQYIPLVREILRDLLESGKNSISKQVSIPVQDNKLTLFVHVTTLKDESDEFMGTVVVFDDLTELIKAQRMAAWREVARRIAHEIKNPLTPIQLSAQRLRRRYLDKFNEDDKVFDECTAMIVQQVEELKNLVNEFSNFARMPSSRPSLNDLNQIVSEALVLYQEGHKQITFAFHPDPHLPHFNLDRDQIKRTIINLIDNAVGAIENEGSITLSTHFNTELQMATLTVADTGSGIAPQIKPRLFEPYFSTKKSGTGLGLAIVSSIVSDHNGYIRVRDNAPRGTQFIVELPIGESSLKEKTYSA